MTVLDIRQRDENTWYYVLDKKGNEGQLHGSKLYDWSQVSEILGEVPSYEEWKASEKYNKHLEEVIKTYERKEKQHTDDAIAYNELAKENVQLKERNDSLNNRDINLCRIANGIRDENFALKELLKEVKDYLPEFETPMDILAKIDEAIKNS